MVKITVYGGAHEIGGNKVLLEDRGTRIFLDFGEPFGLMDNYFVEFLRPRDRFGLRDYFHFDLMPRIDGLYDREWLEDTDLKHVPPRFDAIFLSHMHYDHVWHLKYADRAIPVYLGAAADSIRRSWETTTLSAKFGEHEFRTFRTGSKIKIGCIEVEPVHVDHSVPGAYGFLVHTSDGCVVYTGDLRLHGPRADMTKEFIRRAAAERPIAMICEGTRVTNDDPRKDLSEKGVEEEARKILAMHRGLAVVSFYPKDVDRMRTFRDVARSTGRKFVVSTKVAHLLGALKGDKRIQVPDPLTDPNMLVYVRTGMTKPLAFDSNFMKMRKSGSDHIVDASFVNKHQNELIFHTDFSQLCELIDIKPRPDGIFIRSMSEPFEEDDVQEPVLKAWLDSFRLHMHEAHASGHANMQEIFSMVKEVSPRTVIPIHTQFPELFRRCTNSVKEPRKGVCLEFS